MRHLEIELARATHLWPVAKTSCKKTQKQVLRSPLPLSDAEDLATLLCDVTLLCDAECH